MTQGYLKVGTGSGLRRGAGKGAACRTVEKPGCGPKDSRGRPSGSGPPDTEAAARDTRGARHQGRVYGRSINRIGGGHPGVPTERAARRHDPSPARVNAA